jgi:hypothetical protein
VPDEDNNMSNLFLPSQGPCDWRRLLGDPEKHWVRGKSAFECAVSWEQARTTERGLPQAIAHALDSDDLSANASLLFGIPEHKVQIEGGGHASQNDVWTLLRLPTGTASMAVEAKSGEPFDKFVDEWLRGAPINSRKPQRLASLKNALGISQASLEGIRYQLLHRTVSPLLEARRFNASLAIMIVQSFGGNADDAGFHDFSKFCTLMEADLVRNTVVQCKRKTVVPLLIGWVDCHPATDKQVAEASI